MACIYEELAKARCGGVIVTGSSMEYADTDEACRESDECRPSTPYGRSKLEETEAAAKLSAQWSVPTRVARLFIPFGPLDAPAKVLPYVIENLRQGKAVDLSPCTQRRDFLYVGDVAKAYGLLAGDLKRGGFEIFNVCSGEAVAVRSLIEMIADRLDASRDLLGFGKRQMRPGEPAVSYGSCERARQALGWEPEKLEEGIRESLRSVR
ncbi:MAG: NAD(P)-dependent oxidoreductase [Nitrospirae bacterium]|nr:MAG: NAD(P)-dependent oxidoreductase [Nitrospirota bacterium]